MESYRTLLQVSGPHPCGQPVCPSLSFSPSCGQALRRWPPGWPRSGWATSRHPWGKGRQGRSALRQRGRRAVTVAGPASLAHGPSCGRGLGGGGGQPGHLDIRGRELPGLPGGCFNTALCPLRAQHAQSASGGGGMSKENMSRGSPLVPTLVAHTRPRDQLAS